MGRKKHTNHMKYVDWKIVRFLEKKSYKVDETIHFNPEKYCSKIDEKLQRYKTSRRAKFVSNYHFVFVTKGRVKILFKEVRDLISNQIPIIAKSYGWEILAIEVLPNHMHIFVTLDNKTAPCKYVHRVRTELEKWLCNLVPILRRALQRELFSRSYYFGTVGNVTALGVLKYIKNQWKDYKYFEDKYKKSSYYLAKKNLSLKDFF